MFNRRGFYEAAEILSCAEVYGCVQALAPLKSLPFPFRENQDVISMGIFEMPGCAEQGRGL